MEQMVDTTTPLPTQYECDPEKDMIVIEPVYFGGKAMIDMKKLIRYSFFGAFSAIIFIYYMKIMSNPLFAFLYTFITVFFLGYSGVDPMMFNSITGIYG